jgi:hypothetical protein
VFCGRHPLPIRADHRFTRIERALVPTKGFDHRLFLLHFLALEFAQLSRCFGAGDEWHYFFSGLIILSIVPSWAALKHDAPSALPMLF